MTAVRRQKAQPPIVAVLWGPATRTMSWVELHESGRTQSLASAHPNGFYARSSSQSNEADEALADAVHRAWLLVRNGEDEALAALATHYIKLDEYPARVVPVEAGR